MSTKPSVLIVGAGEFGASTAVSLLKTGQYGKVTVLDRASVLPAMDAASTDMNKVVRWDYSDPDYSLLARKAIDIWNEDFKGIYFQSGVVVRGLESDTVDGEFGRKALANVKLLESSIKELNNPADFKSALDRNGRTPTSALPAESRGYANPVGGWAWAAKAVERLYEQLLELGGELVPSAEMSELIYENGDVVGAKTLDGREFRADKTIVALGSWTPSHPALKGLLKEGLIVATGQTIAAVQLDEEERELYKDIPVTFNFDGSGFYSFPPNPFGVLKFAIHGAGYLSETGVPRTAADPSAVLYTEENDLSWIPSESLKELRYQMSTIYPELAKKPVTYTRMCWYSDVVDGNWVIDYAKPSLLIASGGSGHAFKFLPIMGDLIRARLEGTLEPHLVDKFKLERNTTAEDPQRTGMKRQTLDLGALATGQELRVAA